ncbi:uncharacterized protein LOC131146482 isoform X2 [Malania oleifera]|uniref:uncharacterized protein LOC131146482 isoform X2 n=1 Tax=Malania oleifera TaxID=397392 RepID=UPI0025AE9474|nr:uncharacterized protein LOC131146482 isoform X2 [Malania oleifera]
MATNPSLLPEIGPDGLPREAPVIAYTERIIEAEQLQLKKYIEENYSKIRDVERELANLTLEMKLTAGPKKAALEHMRKKIEMSTERIHVAKLKEEQARKVWEAASKALKEEEEVQESSNAQFSRLEELKRRLEALNPGRVSTSVPQEMRPVHGSTALEASAVPHTSERAGGGAENLSKQGNSGVDPVTNGHNQLSPVVGEGRGKKKNLMQGRGKGFGAVQKSRGSAEPGWTGAGFDVDGRT